jgi:hypothetical protein
MQGLQHQTGGQLEPGMVNVGHKLFAFSQHKVTHLRAVRGGRQALARFALQYATTEDVEVPPEWTKDPRAAARTLEKWLKVPGNPFDPLEEGEIEVIG